MGFFPVASLLITLAALFAYVNYRYIRLPTTIGVMLISLVCSLLLVALGHEAPGFRGQAIRIVSGIDFHQLVLHGLLAFLLFAGSLQLDFNDLRREWDAVAVLSIFGTVASTFLVAGLAWIAFGAMGFAMPPVYCLLFGALISPTDPIAILGIMRNIGASKTLETQITGESLFNDGIGVVIFVTVLDVAAGGGAPSWASLTMLLIKQAVGGAALGLGAGILTYALLKRVADYQVEILLTLALAMGGFALADAIGVSAPIAIVVAGIFIGNQGRSFAMSKETDSHLDTFWELIDEVLNILLFLLIGLEVLVMPFTARLLVAGLVAVGITLLARLASVGGATAVLRLWRDVPRGSVTVLTWGGLRGGLSVAMALSLPPSRFREMLIAVTYAVVVFSVFAQGLTISAVIRRFAGSGPGLTSTKLPDHR